MHIVSVMPDHNIGNWRMLKNSNNSKASSEASAASLFASRLEPSRSNTSSSKLAESLASRLEPGNSASNFSSSRPPPRGPRPANSRKLSEKKSQNQLEARITVGHLPAKNVNNLRSTQGTANDAKNINELAKRISGLPQMSKTSTSNVSKKLDIREFYDQSKFKYSRDNAAGLGRTRPTNQSFRSRSNSPIRSRCLNNSKSRKVIQASSTNMNLSNSKNYRDRSPVTKDDYHNRKELAQLNNSARSRKQAIYDQHKSLATTVSSKKQSSKNPSTSVSGSQYNDRASISIRGAGSKACIKITNIDPATCAADLNSTLIDFDLPQCLDIQLVDASESFGTTVSKTAFIVFSKLREAETCHKFFNGLLADQKILKSEIVPANHNSSISIKNRHLPYLQKESS
ncbi:hypothetical protein NADFUDRAFT_81863 [Nadsonia fulvescens var. elongata DSM 6958]|uniref:Uncharacterized protein n=1 Tax=Nadsonia fulvescens var. elongata DSM 6958 TaxID=857566 RepID=A0A1E3PPJ9_9ASCO|nr:hypothetical protein NADFUDRAFT_81863 [Nadsonia fulvescens var. elongata DSM 6958]